MIEQITKMEFNSPFYPRRFNNEQKNAVRESKVWPIIMTLKAELDLSLFYYTRPSATYPHVYGLCDEYGFRQLELKVSETGEISMHIRSNSLSTRDPEEVLNSSNVKYILGRISKLMREEGDNFLRRIKGRGMSDLYANLKAMVAQTITTVPESDRVRYNPQFDTETRLSMMEILSGDVPLSSIPTEVYQVVMEEKRKVKDAQERSQQTFERLRPYLEGKKFVLITASRPMTQFILAGVELLNLDSIFSDAYKSQYSWYSSETANYGITYVPRRYRNIDELPDDIQDVVRATIAMDKINRTSKQRFDSQDQTIPWGISGAALFNNSSTMCFREGNTSYNFYVIPDKRELLA